MDDAIKALDAVRLSGTSGKVLTLDRKEGYEEVMGFFQEAADAAESNPDTVKLYFASAPVLEIELMSRIISQIKHKGGLPFRQVVFFLRDDHFETILGDKKIRKFFRENVDHEKGKVRVYVSQELYFHTKWYAYKPDGKGSVQIMCTSANIISSHLKQVSDPKKNSINSFISDSMEKLLFKRNLLYPMFQTCHLLCTNFDAKGVPRFKNTVQTPMIQNLSSHKVYKEIEKFVNDVHAQANAHPSAGHTIYIVSPYVLAEKKYNGESVEVNRTVIDKFLSLHTNQPVSEPEFKVRLRVIHHEFEYKSRYNTQEYVKALASLRTEVEQKIEHASITRASNKFHIKLIAHVDDDKDDVQVINMSANFTSQNMTIDGNDTYENLEWLYHHSMTKSEWEAFMSKLIKK